MSVALPAVRATKCLAAVRSRASMQPLSSRADCFCCTAWAQEQLTRAFEQAATGGHCERADGRVLPGEGVGLCLSHVPPYPSPLPIGLVASPAVSRNCEHRCGLGTANC